MDPKIIELENKISVEQDAAARTRLETELAGLNATYNALVQDEQVKLAKSQTLERYIEKGKTWVDSLQNQAATQMVLINKLQTDTKQRVVLYDALSKSLKTAQQQDVAHRINEIGVETDQEAQAAMAAIGSATNTRMAEMMEAHEDHMVFAREGAGAEGQGGRALLQGGSRRSSRSTTRTCMGPIVERQNPRADAERISSRRVGACALRRGVLGTGCAKMAWRPHPIDASARGIRTDCRLRQNGAPKPRQDIGQRGDATADGFGAEKRGFAFPGLHG